MSETTPGGRLHDTHGNIKVTCPHGCGELIWHGQHDRHCPATHYQDAAGWHRKHDLHGGPHDEPPSEMTPAPETTETAYDPIPDLAWLLGAAQREEGTVCAKIGTRLISALGLPELAWREEALSWLAQFEEIEKAIRKPVRTVTKGDVITIVPERGPSRRMVVAHVEHHIITLADLEPVTAVTRDNGGQESGG